MDSNTYSIAMSQMRENLVDMQEWIKKSGLKVVVIFEGRDASGKGGVIKRITDPMNPRVVKVVALGVPTEREKGQWYFQRYVPYLPAKGEMVIFDRSWYNRAGVERVMGFCNDEEYHEFLRSCPEFEHMLIKSGIILIKYWFSVSEEEQERRFQARVSNPLKRWKFSPMDLKSRAKWVEYSKAKDNMLKHTDTEESPWYIVRGDDKKKARLNCIHHLLSKIPFKSTEHPPIKLPPLKKDPSYKRPSTKNLNYVPEFYQ
jgi:polyphosphate kinase 2